MKRDFSVVLTDLDGVPLHPQGTAEGLIGIINAIRAIVGPELQKRIDEMTVAEIKKPLTLASVCVSALLGAYEDEKMLGEDERLKRMDIARRLNKGGVQDIKLDDLVIIKPLLRKRFAGVLVPVTAAELLEKEYVEPAAEETQT